MKRLFLAISFIAAIAISGSTSAQTNTYSTSGGELIFSWGDMKYTSNFMNSYPEAGIVSQPVRFTAFFHIQQFWHMDFNNSLGLFTGIGMRNIGMISDEVLPTAISDEYTSANPYAGEYFNAKIIRRSYTVGIPLALKLGSFKDHLHIYGGGEMEWAFHMKEKYWDGHSRSASKSKPVSGGSGWFPEQITTFQPSAFIGLQFPGGINLKFKYYLENFLNHNYKAHTGTTTSTRNNIVSDLTKYEQSNLFYVSLSFHFKTAKLVQQESKGAVAYID